jgi:hypothetical protein
VTPKRKKKQGLELDIEEIREKERQRHKEALKSYLAQTQYPELREEFKRIKKEVP